MTPPSSPADWQLPPGVSRGLWDYLHDAAVARGYDASLTGSALVQVDQQFVERHCPRPGKLIDLGCGTGRLLIPFARRGYSVLGVDLSEEMLRVAGAKAAAEGVSVQLLRANLTELDAPLTPSPLPPGERGGGEGGGCFDCAACLFSTLGMVSGAEQRRRVVAHAYRLLRPGGRFVLHVHNRWFNFWNPRGRRWLVRNTLGALVRRAQAGDCLMPVHQGIANLTLHLFTRREVCRLLRQAGFRIREVKPVSLRADGELSRPWWFGWLRAYGYLLAAERPS